MATHSIIDEEMLSHFVAGTQREQNIENNNDVDHGEERADYQHMCSYEIREAIGGESVVIGDGGAFVVNRSKQGILLLTAFPLHSKQLIEVDISRSGWRRTLSVFEPRWTKSRQVESRGDLYLVGCRRKFGPCDYWSF
jgi:hypothetical protein